MSTLYLKNASTSMFFGRSPSVSLLSNIAKTCLLMSKSSGIAYMRIAHTQAYIRTHVYNPEESLL